MLEYVNDRATVAITALDDWDLDFDTPGANHRSGQRSAELSEACVREQLVPQLAAYVKQKLDSLSSPALLDYRFSFWGKFQTDTGELKLPIFHSVDQEKRARLLANISAYVTELFADYAREAMEQFAWYADADDEKNVMPGSYAVFGLGLADRRYFSLVEDYMGKIDEEHQSAKNQFTAAFAKNARRESRDAANACRVPAARNGRAEAEN
ncbi:hypothetical protein BAG01nite_05530 [Brevibacillus agri]|uniref:Uncharacterized protein n=1 Tax=Brevibacillus agri TaxID=51101 RepID=A0ABQ0SKU5_9BACL|nr:DUF6138 family protein [Brevibacillus agri]GED24451.1 hypothetical protein BAG01nite_05530 [Brevibacillus agri]